MTYTLITRSIIIYLLVFFLIRLMGKRQIGEMQPFELVITLIIADLATIPMAETALPLVHGIIPIITLAILHYLLTFLSQKSLRFRKWLNGKPVIVINPNGINFKAMKKLNMNYNDLMEGIRDAGYFNLEEILYAIMQTNGTLTVLPRSAYSPLTADAVNLKVEESSLPVILVDKGKSIKENLVITKLDDNFIDIQLKKLNIPKKEVVFLSINSNGKMYIQPENGKFQIVQTNYKGDGNW